MTKSNNNLHNNLDSILDDNFDNGQNNSQNTLKLRALEPSDLDLLYKFENDPEVWRVSGTTVPFSRHILRRFIDSSFTDIYQSGQLRLIIDLNNQAIGSIDIFDFDPHNSRAGIGIIIFNHNNRGKGYADRAATLLIEYCFSTLMLHQIYCNINSDNIASISLFKKHGFIEVGIKKDWNRVENQFYDEVLLQKIRSSNI